MSARPGSADGALPALARDRVTSVIAAGYVLLGAANASLGPVGDELRRSLHLSGAVTGLHGAMFGWFLLASGVGSAWLTRRSPAAAFRVAVVGMGVGLTVIAAGRHVAVTLLGAACAGAGGAVMVFVTPQLLNARHGAAARAAAFTFVNALSQVGSVVAPLVLALALHDGVGWRWVLAAVGVFGGAAVLAAVLRTRLPSAAPKPAEPVGPAGSAGPPRSAGSAPRQLARHPVLRRRWLVLTLGISIEFALLFWGAAALRDLAHATTGTGAVGVSLFAAGMIVGRIVGPGLIGRVLDVVVLRTSFAGAGACALLLRFAPGVGPRLAALGLAGLSLALVYPLAFARQYAAGAHDDDVGAVGALASGTAVTFAPLALGALADATSLPTALLVIPAMAAAALVLLGRPTFAVR